jgi:NADPH-dependent 2,4-dienoyl-CoA reductase/sulfur reductase-like enzyme
MNAARVCRRCGAKVVVIENAAWSWPGIFKER